MKKGKPYFSPLNFNVIAVFWIVAVVPLAVAWVSNLGSDYEGDKEYERVTVPYGDLIYNDGIPIYQGGTLFTNYSGDDLSWYSNGDDYSWYYYLNNPNLEQYNLDCAYIVNGLCEGSIDPINESVAASAWTNSSFYGDCDGFFAWNYNGIPFNYQENVPHNCAFANPNYFANLLTGFYKFELSYDNSWFWRGTDSHGHAFNGAPSANITDSSYVGDSGDKFSFRMNERILNQMPQGEMVDSLRFTILDFPDSPVANPTSYNCQSHQWDNFTVSTKITQFYDGRTNVIDGYVYSTWNKYYFDQNAPQYFYAGCYHGYEVIVDFNGLDTRSMYNFVDGGKWNESTMVIEFKYEREDGLPIGNTNLAINGNDDFIIAIDYAFIPAQQVETATNIGLLTLSAGNVILAMASTPYWDPFKNFFKGKL